MDANATKRKLVPQNQRPGQPIRPFDAKVAALIDDDFFITTPNADFVPQPPLGHNRELFMRADFRYADDDPIQWPQPYWPLHAHQACIPREPPRIDRSSIMWRTPNIQCCNDFVYCLNHEFKKEAQDVINQLLQAVSKHRQSLTDTTAKISLSSLINLTLNFWERITTLPMTKNELLRCFAELQRFYRELTGMLDFLRIYRPRMNGLTAPATSTADRLGAFTFDPNIVQEFASAGLPVWFIRPIKDLYHVRIEEVVQLQSPQGLLEFKPSKPRFPTIFRGKATNPRRTDEIRVASRIALHCSDVFAESDSPPPSNGTSTSLPISRAVDRQASVRYGSHPYKLSHAKREQHKYFASLPLIVPPNVPYAPTVAQAWLAGFSRVVPSACFPTLLPKAYGTALPDPSLFLDLKSQCPRHDFIMQWLRLRPLLLQRLCLSSMFVARPLARKVWRAMLMLKSDTCDLVLSSPATTQAAEERYTAVLLLQQSMEALFAQGPLSTLLTSVPIFRAEEVTDAVLQQQSFVNEVLWELAELNWRMELKSIDAVRNGPLDTRHELLLDCMCPSGTPRYLLALDITRQSRSGLASPKPQDRLVHLIHLKHLMVTWHGYPRTPFLAEPDHYPTVELILQLEELLFETFVWCFYSFFGRAPIVPRTIVD
ncbi:hypothetical protein FA15DRAFT_701834 [Coprinopsis marcescibilis]|uniref:Uncharacterized protein n=1 Tax=Coprinopsis marcescibilis TaxID=230819 RepID=A0A5C3L3R1_COPMA|nr:hypothetical protein FA15DRAFT_701834 [Coprinopsis marcescibilis]